MEVEGDWQGNRVKFVTRQDRCDISPESEPETCRTIRRLLCISHTTTRLHPPSFVCRKSKKMPNRFPHLAISHLVRTQTRQRAGHSGVSVYGRKESKDFRVIFRPEMGREEFVCCSLCNQSGRHERTNGEVSSSFSLSQTGMNYLLYIGVLLKQRVISALVQLS